MTAGLAYDQAHLAAAVAELPRLTPADAVAELVETARDDVYRYLLTLWIVPAQPQPGFFREAHNYGLTPRGHERRPVRLRSRTGNADSGCRRRHAIERSYTRVPNRGAAIAAIALALPFLTFRPARCRGKCGTNGLSDMNRAVAFMVLCAASLASAFAQDASVASITGLGYLNPVPATVAPGQLITVFLAGNVQGNITATVSQISTYPAPVLEVRPASDCTLAPPAVPCSSVTGVTIQVPYELIPLCLVCATPASLYTRMYVSVNGAEGALFGLTPLADHVHILTSCDTVVPGGGGYAQYNGLPCPPLVTHADGSLVARGTPAKGGEDVVAYAVGLGATSPAVATGNAATGATPTAETFYLDFNFHPNALAAQPAQTTFVPLYAGLVPGYVGLYQVNFVVPQPPAGTPACSDTVQTNLTVSVGGAFSFDGAGICVAPAE